MELVTLFDIMEPNADFSPTFHVELLHVCICDDTVETYHGAAIECTEVHRAMSPCMAKGTGMLD